MKTSNPNFYLQWHITNRCSQRCSSCYLFQSKKVDFAKKELELRELILIAKDMIKTAEILKANTVFVLTGGDSMMHPEFWLLLEKIHQIIKKSSVEGTIDLLGNPFYVNSFSAERLKACGVRKFQLSLDGLEKKHDILRKAGSYKETLRAAKDLKKSGIETTCMFTLSKFNAPDLISVMRKVAEEGFNSFAFARLCRPESWSIEKYRREMFSAEEYKRLLLDVYEAHQKLAKTHPRTKFVFKDHLWELFFYERYSEKDREELKEIQKEKIVTGGCSLGVASLSILADGVVYACRRFESPIGRVPKQKLIDLFIDSKKLNTYRDFSHYKKCKTCPLLYVCRGCGAVVYGYSGSFFDPDPQCWYNID